MRFTKCNLWISVNICEYLWIFVNICEYLWTSVNICDLCCALRVGRAGFGGNSLALSRAQPYPWHLPCFHFLLHFGHNNLQCVSNLDLHCWDAKSCEIYPPFTDGQEWHICWPWLFMQPRNVHYHRAAAETQLVTTLSPSTVECCEVSMLRDDASSGPVFQQSWVSCHL